MLTRAPGLTLAACAMFACSAPAGRPVEVSIATDRPIATVSPRYLSLAVDAAQVVGGPFWSASGEVSLIGDERRPPYQFSRPKLLSLARVLAPAYLRIGGSAADLLYYDLGETPGAALPQGFELALTRAEWDGVNHFALEAGFEVMFTLNVGPGPRDADGGWNADHARALLEYSAARGYRVAVWELGNEVNGFPFVHRPPFSRSAEGYAADFTRARALIDAQAPLAKLAGPASAYWPEQGEVNPVLADFLSQAGALVDIVTWHYYPQQSRRCPIAVRRASPELMLLPANLDELRKWASTVEKAQAASAAGAEVWLGETGNAQCGGEPGVSDAFAGTFWWLDELGLIARRGQQVVVRQTLSGSNYGLLDEDTLTPKPDFWASVLWKRLMGTRVLEASAAEPLVRVYAHCAPEGGGALSALALNLDGEQAVRLSFPGVSGPAELFLLTSPELGSAELLLDGVPLALDADGALPSLAARPIGSSPEVVLPARAIALVRFLSAAAPACAGN